MEEKLESLYLPHNFAEVLDLTAELTEMQVLPCCRQITPPW